MKWLDRIEFSFGSETDIRLTGREMLYTLSIILVLVGTVVGINFLLKLI